MNKTLRRALLCVAFVVCLIVAMIPIMSIRTNAEPASITFYISGAGRVVQRGQTRCYTTDADGALTEISATSEDYNIKITYPEDDTPTMYLKGAYVKNMSNNTDSITADSIASKLTIVVEKTTTGTVAVGSATKQADSFIGTAFQWKGGDIVIEGRDNAKLEVGINTNMWGQSITYKDLNLAITGGTAYGGAPRMITFNNTVANITNTSMGVNFWDSRTSEFMASVQGFTVTGNSVINWQSGSSVIYGANAATNAKFLVESGSVRIATTAADGKIFNAYGPSHYALDVRGGTVELVCPSDGTGCIGLGMYSATNYRNSAGENVYNTVAGVDAATATAHSGGSGLGSAYKYFRFEPAYTVSVTDGTAVAKAPAGATVTLTPGTVAGKAFDSWSSSDVTIAENEGVYSFTMPAKNVAVTANFVYRSTIKLAGTDYTFTDAAPIYLKTGVDGTITGEGAATDYNVKLYYNDDKLPVIKLNGAKLTHDKSAIDTGDLAEVIIETIAPSTLYQTEDFIAEGKTNDDSVSNDKEGAIKTAGKVTFSGDALLTLKGNASAIYGTSGTTSELVFNNANVSISKLNASGKSGGWYDNTFGGSYSAITFNGGKATVSSTRFVILNTTTITVDNGAEVTVPSNSFTWSAQTVHVKDGSFYMEGSNAELLRLTTVIVDANGVFEAVNTSTSATAVISTKQPTIATGLYAVIGADKATATAFDTASTSISGKYFKVGKAYNVTVTNGTAQSTGVAAATVKAFVGDTVNLIANEAPAGQVLMGWNVTAGGATLNGTSFTMPAADVAVSASFGVAGGITIGSNEYTVIKGGAAIYFKTDDNGVVTVAGDENDYNLKFVYADEEGAVPTLYLKGAKVDAAIKSNAFSAGTTKIVTETDSTVTGAITWSTGELIISGSGKLSLTKTITTTGANLVFKDANVELKTGTSVGMIGQNITFNGGKFVFESTNSLISDWTTNSRTIRVTGDAQVIATSKDSASLVLANANASFIVESGYVKLSSDGDSLGTRETDGFGYVLRGTGTFKINGGIVELAANEFVAYGSSGIELDLSDYENYYSAYSSSKDGTNLKIMETTTITAYYKQSYAIKFVKIAPAYTITVNGATASASEACAGMDITLTPVLPVGKKLDSWTLDNGSAEVTITNNKFTMPEGNVSITANYVDDPLYDGEPNELIYKFAGYKLVVTRGETYYLITDASGAVTATGATADNYNIKVEYEFGKSPVIYLRGAYIKGSYGSIINNDYGSLCTDAQRASKVVIVVEKELGNAVSAVPAEVTADSYLVSYIFLSKGGVEIQGPGKLVMDDTTVKENGADKVISAKIQATGDLTFKNADVQILNGALKGANITFDGGKVDITADDEVIVSIWQSPYTVLVTNDADVTFTSNNKAAMHIVGTDAAKAALQIDSGSLVLKSNATGTNSEHAALKMTKADLKINGGTMELIGSVTVVTGNIEMTLNGTFDAICANNTAGTGAVAYKDTTIKQYNSSFQLKYFKIQPGTGSSDDDSGNTGTGTHKHSTTKVRGKAASCTADGVKEHYKCSCGKFFEDKAAKKEIKDIDTWKVIKATGHKDADKDGICETCKKSAQTSDSSFTALWITLLTVSAMGMCVTFVYNKKKATK